MAFTSIPHLDRMDLRTLLRLASFAGQCTPVLNPKSHASRDCLTSSYAEKTAKTLRICQPIPLGPPRKYDEGTELNALIAHIASSFCRDAQCLACCAGDALYRERQDKVQEGMHRRGGGKVIVFVLNETECRSRMPTPGAPPPHSLDASLPPHGSTPMRESLSSDTHQCNTTSSWPNIVVSPVGFWTSARTASHEKVYTEPGHTRELQHWLNRPSPSNQVYTQDIELTLG
ncbi:hypothetical protein EDB86DRAFT_1374949 [Lactarius hatsudake]|nr:hypothetical protein EDB86DRAFT_1374949 [Lactarius hatsudake]